MKSSTPHQRIGVFVDVQNMFYSAYDCFRGRLNYKKLLETVTGDRQVVRAVAYAMRDGNNQGSFFTMLREVGFELRTKEPRVRPDGSQHRVGGGVVAVGHHGLQHVAVRGAACERLEHRAAGRTHAIVDGAGRRGRQRRDRIHHRSGRPEEHRGER